MERSQRRGEVRNGERRRRVGGRWQRGTESEEREVIAYRGGQVEGRQREGGQSGNGTMIQIRKFKMIHITQTVISYPKLLPVR